METERRELPYTAEESVGFLKVLEVGSPRAWRGGYLVTDLRGSPKRFCRTTEDLVLGRLQATLLGRSLERYVYCDAIGRPLVQGESSEVTLVIVDHEALLELRPLVDVPVLLSEGGENTVHPHFSAEQEMVDRVASRLDLVEGTAEVFERIAAVLLASTDLPEDEVGAE